jgi:hypothetical protein
MQFRRSARQHGWGLQRGFDPHGLTDFFLQGTRLRVQPLAFIRQFVMQVVLVDETESDHRHQQPEGKGFDDGSEPNRGGLVFGIGAGHGWKR